MVADQRLSPTYTADLARALVEAVDEDAAGLLHLTAEGECSWFEFTQAIMELADLEVPVEPVRDDPASRRCRPPAERGAPATLHRRRGAHAPAPLEGWARCLHERSGPPGECQMTFGSFERRLVAVATVAFAGIGIAVLAGGAPVAWLLLGLCGVVSASVLVAQFYRGRLFEPLTVIAAVALVSFVARPLQLFLSADDLRSYYFQGSALNSLLKIENQEIALFVTRDLKEPLEPALTRAMGAVTIFVCFVLVGYLLPWGRRWADRLAGVGQGMASRIDVQPAVVACLLIAAIGQIAMLVKVGGPAEAANHMLDQEVLGTGLAYQVLLGFGTAAVLIWAAWDTPRTTRARVAFVLVLLEVCGFYALAGTRTRVFVTFLMMAVIVHYLVRPWRRRELLAGVIAVVVFASALLGVRQATTDKPIGEALSSAPKYLLDPRGVLNDMTEFDGIFTATTVIGSPHEYRSPAPFQYGKGILAAFHSYVPARIDPDKPDSGDVEFRKLVWGDEHAGGAPVHGDRGLLERLRLSRGGRGLAPLRPARPRAGRAGLTPRRRGPGREYRVVLYAIALVRALHRAREHLFGGHRLRTDDRRAVPRGDAPDPSDRRPGEPPARLARSPSGDTRVIRRSAPTRNTRRWR